MNNNDPQIDSLIKNMARQHQPELPSPGLIWWRAQIQRKLAAKERVERPMIIMRMISLIVLAIVVGGIVAANWHGIAPDNDAKAGPLAALGVLAVASLLIAASMVIREGARKG